MFKTNSVKWMWLLVLVVTSSLGSVVVADTTLRVDGDSGLTLALGATGVDWSHAFLYLQDALAEAASSSPPVQIWVKGDDDTDGIVYFPDDGDGLTPGTQALTFSLRSNVQVLCGFQGSESTANARDASVWRVTLCGDIDHDNAIDAEDSHHVVTADTVGNSARLDGATIFGGFSDDSPSRGGDNDALESIIACLASAEELGLEGQEWIDFMLACLKESGVIEGGD